MASVEASEAATVDSSTSPAGHPPAARCVTRPSGQPFGEVEASEAAVEAAAAAAVVAAGAAVVAVATLEAEGATEAVVVATAWQLQAWATGNGGPAKRVTLARYSPKCRPWLA